jgi:16S rRNA (guanine527-N7)-methyltransferase
MHRLIQEITDLTGISINQTQLSAFETYSRELAEWNTRFNLTAIRDKEQVRVKHFLDSLSCLLVMRNSNMQRIVDVGTGAGFPGLPLKILCPNMHLTLVESIGKKTDFLRHIVQVLSLEGVEILHMRAERVGHIESQRQSYDWAIARAVAPLPVLVEYLLPLVRIGGRILAQKGESGRVEVQSAEGVIGLMGGDFREILPVTLPGIAGERCLVVIEKTAATPDKYPRRVGIPTKRPLK